MNNNQKYAGSMAEYSDLWWRDRCALDDVGFLPQVSHDNATSTAVVGQKSSPTPCVVGEGRAVRSGAQIPMITELGQFLRPLMTSTV